MYFTKSSYNFSGSSKNSFSHSAKANLQLLIIALLFSFIISNTTKAQMAPTSHQDRFGAYHWTGDYRGLKPGSNDPVNYGASLAGSLGTHTIRIALGPNYNNINTCDTVWFDDSPPAGSSLGSDGDNWNNPENSNLAPLFPFSGSVAFKSSSVAGMHQLFFLTSDQETLKINPGDILFAYIYITSTSSQNSQVMLQWHEQNGTFDHRAYWGANQLTWGSDGTFSRRNAGNLPETGKWVRLEIPASSVGLEGKTLDGLAFSLYDCQAIWDRAGVSKNQTVWLEDASIPVTGINAINDSPGAQPHPFSGNVAYQTANDSSFKNLAFYMPSTMINAGDYLVSWVYLNPNNPPQEIMLQWFVDGDPEGAWEHRAYWGPNLIQFWGFNDSNSRRNIGLLPVTGKWVRLEVPASLVGLEGKKVTNFAVTIDKGQIAWDRVGKSLNETVWIDDTASQGTPTNSNPVPFSGEVAFKSTLEPAMHQFIIDKTADPLKINNGDILFAHVYLDPDAAKSPGEVMLQWKEPNNSWEHRAYWGPDLIQFWGFNGTISRKNLGPLPDSGRWIRLEIPASSVGLEGKTIDAVAFTIYGGQATIDRVGKINSLTGVVTNPVYDKLFRNPQFTTYLLTTYSSGAGNNNWLDGFTNEEKQVEREEIKQLGKYLLYPGRYPNKKFIILNWEGDHAFDDYNHEIWVDDEIPYGATPGVTRDEWRWVLSNPMPYSGKQAHQSNRINPNNPTPNAADSLMRQHYFENASKKITVNAGDYLYTWVYLDPSDTPTEIMLQWHENGSWEHRAYWGPDLIQFWGFNGTTSRKNIGALPAAGQWVPLLVPANAVGLEGKTIDGMAFTLFNGSATWDQTGIRKYLPNNTHWDDYRDWINTRALGVNDANSSISGSTASLYSGLEFTQTYARDNLSNYYLDVNHNRIRCGTPSTTPNYIPNPANPGQWIVDPNSPTAPTKYQCVIDRIAPQALVNYFSYSAYETVNLKYPFNSGPPLNGGLNYCLKSGFKSNLDFALSKLSGKTEANFIVGEWGFDPYFAGGDVNPAQFRYDRSKAFFDEMFGSFNLSDSSAFHPAYLITWDTEYAGENAAGFNFSLFTQWNFVQNQWILNRGTELVKSPHGEAFQANLTTPPPAFSCPQNPESLPPPNTQPVFNVQRYTPLNSITSLRSAPSHRPR